MEKGALNIYDIAKKAGVSIATVSRVLGGNARVREETRRRVMAVIEETGYTPNAFARGLGFGSMKMVGILCTDVSDLFYGKAVSNLERLLRGHGLDALLQCSGDSPAGKKQFLKHMLTKGVDAVILVGSTFSEAGDNSHIEQAAAQTPVIIINGLVECPGVYCVLCDEQAGLRDSVIRLYGKGCRNILYLYSADTFSGRQKLAGYRQGLVGCGLAENPALIRRCGGGPDDAQEAAKAALDCNPVDGILCSDDILAVGACKALAQRGLTIPVSGFNNSLIARCASPAVTSVDNMVDTLCINAVDVLTGLLNGGASVPAKIVVTPAIVERET